MLPTSCTRSVSRSSGDPFTHNLVSVFLKDGEFRPVEVVVFDFCDLIVDVETWWEGRTDWCSE